MQNENENKSLPFSVKKKENHRYEFKNALKKKENF